MSWNLPPLSALRAFEATARLGTMTAAGEELHISQVAVSRQMASLEERLRVQLFVRGHRSVRLTGAGESLFVAVTRSFHELQTAVESMGTSSGNVLKICGYVTFTMRWLIPRIQDFHARHPGIDIQLKSSMEPVDFDRSDIDVAIRAGDGNWPDWDCVRLAQIELLPVCSPKLLGKQDAVDVLKNLSKMTLLHSKVRPLDWRTWLEAADLGQVNATSGITFDNSSFAYQAAIEGAGVAIAQKVLVAGDLANGQLVALSDLAVPSGDSYYFVAPRRRLLPKASAFRDWLVDAMNDSARHP